MNTQEILNKLKQDKAMIQHADMDFTLELMFSEIGSTDAELRDHIVYSLFVELILYQPLTSEQLHFIAQRALSDECMFYKIGEENTDSIFRRSFSILLVPLLLDRNDTERFLMEKSIQQIKNAILRYLSEEKDFRGYVPDKGWAHALAHISDAIQSISEQRWTVEEVIIIFNALKNIIHSYDNVLTNQEEERILVAIMPMIVCELININTLQHWIQELADFESTHDASKDYVILHNTKVLLSALYFKVRKYTSLQEAVSSIETTINALNRKFL